MVGRSSTLANCQRWCQQTVCTGCSLMMAERSLQNHQTMGRSSCLPKITIACTERLGCSTGGHMSSSWLAHSPPTDDPTCGTTAMCGSPFIVRSKCGITCRRYLLPNKSPTLAKRWQSSIGRPLAWLASCHPHQKLSHRMRLPYTI